MAEILKRFTTLSSGGSGFNGGVITTPLGLPDGTNANPALYFSSDTDTGLYLLSADVLGIATGAGTGYIGLASTASAAKFDTNWDLYTFAGSANTFFSLSLTAGARLESGIQYGWTPAGDPTAAADTGLARNAAGVLRATDGSTGIRGFMGGGTAVASATALPVPTGRVFHVTGTTTITSITSTNFQAGAVITLIFDGILTFTDGNNLVLAGNFVTSADDTITLVFDGTNWYEIARSVN